MPITAEVQSLPKPTSLRDVSRLHALARRLAGRPVPGVRMTGEEFDAWCNEQVRAEWVDGEVILVSPSNIPHADLNLWLASLMRSVAEIDDAGRVLLDTLVRLDNLNQRREPDILFISRSREWIIQHTHIDGPPDIVMEIVSPDSPVRDWHDKYLAYEQSGVREYWVIDPSALRVEAYALGRDRKFKVIRPVAGCIRSKVLRKFYIRPSWLWQSPLLKTSAVLKELGVRG